MFAQSNRRWIRVALASTVVALVASVPTRAGAISTEHARSYFRQAKELSAQDGGHLWGMPLYGPMMFVDRQTRAVVANEPDGHNVLKPSGSVFVGTLPKDVLVANTAVDWAGKKWTMVMWPLPSDEHARGRLLAHEMFHRIQDKIGLPAGNPANVHLDSAKGRLWLRLEWRALARALESDGTARHKAIEDALSFRAYRRSIFPDARSQERALENNEGLAEYTGVMLAGWTSAERNHHVIEALHSAEDGDSFVRSFAYASGPAWGILLDELAPDWRASYKTNDDLGDRLAAAVGIHSDMAKPERPSQRMKQYDGESVERQEAERAARIQKRQKLARARFIDGPTLRIPLRQMQIEFDPRALQPLGDVGTVYPTLKVTDEWGVLTVSDGALVGADWTWVAVPVPADWSGSLSDAGKGWTLDAKSSWHARPRTSAKGCWELSTGR